MKNAYPSATENFQAGKPVYFEPWIDAQGPTGRRNIIEGILLRTTAQIDVATATLQGENLARLFNQILIEDVGGVRWNTSGEGARMLCSTMLVGPQMFHEHADVSAASDIAIEHWMYIPFSKPWVHRVADFAIPADTFAKMTITHPTQATLDLGSSAVTVDSNDITAWGICREEDTVEHKMRDIVSETTAQAATQAKILVPGAYIAEILAYSSGDAGATMAGWDSHSIDKIQPQVMDENDYLALYQLMRKSGDHGATPGGDLYNDPILTDKARLIYAPPCVHGDLKLADMPFHNGNLTIRATSSVTPTFIHRFIEAKSEKVQRQVNALYNADPASERAKTRNKTRRAASDWKSLFQYITTSVRPMG